MAGSVTPIAPIASRLERSFEKFEAEAVRKLQFQPAGAWSKAERGQVATSKRIKRAEKDFWFYDLAYYPPETFRQGYAEPDIIHQETLRLWYEPGIQWLLAPRFCAKTAYGMKILIWDVLYGRANIVGIYCEDLRKARLIIEAIEFILTTNPRLVEDFGVTVTVSNDDMLQFTCATNLRPVVIMPFSPERSPRGNNVGFERLDLIMFDDVETETSSFSDEATDHLLNKLVEAFKSLRQGGTMIGFGNNLHPRCLGNRLLKEQEKGNGRDHVRVHKFKAFARAEDKLPYHGSVWKSMYPGPTEKDVRRQMRITSDKEWSEAQCDPKKFGGLIFPEQFLRKYKLAELPADARGPGWCDQNLSLKGMGDTTAHGRLLFSPSAMMFYGYRMRCKSYSDPNTLLDDYFAGFDNRTTRMGMDGNVSQESSWYNHILNWCRITKKAPPPVEFKHYTVDHHIALAQIVWFEGRVAFEEEWIETEEGQRFIEQLTEFQGKKAGKKDDAPDWLICALKFGYDTEDYNAGSGDVAEDYKVTVVHHKFRF